MIEQIKGMRAEAQLALDGIPPTEPDTALWQERHDAALRLQGAVAALDSVLAIDEVQAIEADVLRHAREAHERHVNLLEGCPLCELEAAHQRDRLACNMCGEPLDPSQPFDGHRDCREQE